MMFTPPGSPESEVLGHSLDSNNLSDFVEIPSSNSEKSSFCLGKLPKNPKNFLRRSDLNRLKETKERSLGSSGWIKLFGLTSECSELVFNEISENLFFKNFFKILESSSSGNHEECFEYLKFIRRFDRTDNFSRVMKLARNLYLSVPESLGDFLPNSPSVHLILDLRLTVLYLFFRLDSFLKVPFELCVEAGTFTVSSDEIKITEIRKSLLRRFVYDLISLQEIPCSCFLEAWAILKYYFSITFDSPEYFWSTCLSFFLSRNREKENESIEDCSIIVIGSTRRFNSKFFWKSLEYLTALDKCLGIENGLDFIEPFLRSELLDLDKKPDEIYLKLILNALASVSEYKSLKLVVFYCIWDYFNKHLCDISNDIRSLSFLPKSAKKWNETPPTDESSFSDFLNLLRNSASRDILKKIRNRVLSKLTPKKVKDFNDVQVYKILRLFSLFVSKSEEDTENIVETCLRAFEPLEESSIFVIGLGGIALQTKILNLQIFREIDRRIEKILSLFSPENSSLRTKIQALISVHFELIEESQNGSIHFPAYILKYIKLSNHSEINFILKKLRFSLEKFSTRPDHLVSYIKKELVNQNPQEGVGTFLASYVQTLPDHLFQEQLNYFSSSPSVNPTITLHFLLGLVQLGLTHKINPLYFATGFVKCASLLGNSDILEVLLPHVLERCEFRCPLISSTDPIEIFVRAVEIKHKEHSNRILYFSYFQPYFDHLSNGGFLNDYIYSIGACLIKYIPSILYASGSTLNGLNTLSIYLLTGKKITSEIETNPSLHNRLKKYLPEFIQGLAAIQPKDSFISRTLREVLSTHILRFKIDSPILSTVVSTPSILPIIGSIIISNEFLGKYGLSSSDYTKILDFIKGLLSLEINSSFQSFCGSLSGPLLRKFFNHQTGKDLLKKVLVLSPFDILTSNLLTIVHSELAFKSKQVFDILRIVKTIRPEIIETLLPKIQHEVVSIEARRGVGGPLRNALCDLQNLLK